MNAVVVWLIVFGAAAAGAGIGMALRSRLPDHHFSQECKEVVNLGLGLISAMVALVLGLLVASAAAAFTAQQQGFQTLAANVVLLDRGLMLYGTRAKPARDALHRTVVDMVRHSTTAAQRTRGQGLESAALSGDGAELFRALAQLAPTSEFEKDVQSQALELTVELGRTRWLLSEQAMVDSIPKPFLVMVAVWLGALFVGYGMFAPRNPTVVASLIVAAMSAAGAVFLIMELQQPFDGFIQISNGPLHSALAQLEK